MQDFKIYLRETSKFEVMTHKRETTIGHLIQAGECDIYEQNRLHDEMINGNLRFVISIAKKYQGQGLPLMDLINEGNMGMIRALEDFDWTRGLRFITYAVWWIKQSILQALNEYTRTIRLPANVINEQIKVWKHATTSNDEEIADISPAQTHTISYDIVIGEGGGTLLNSLEDDDSLNPDYSFNVDSMMMDKVKEGIQFLNDREREVISMVFGLGGEALTMDQIAEDWNLTKERIRQIKEKAIRKMRSICL